MTWWTWREWLALAFIVLAFGLWAWALPDAVASRKGWLKVWGSVLALVAATALLDGA